MTEANIQQNQEELDLDFDGDIDAMILLTRTSELP